MNKEKTLKVGWVPFLKLYTKIRIPWLLYILAFLFGFAFTWVGIKLAPFLTKIQLGRFEDNVIWWFVGFTLLSIIIMVCRGLLDLYANQKLTQRLRNQLLHKILNTSIKVYDSDKPSGFISRVTNDAAMASDATSVVTRFFASLYGLIGALVSMYSLNPKLSTMYALMIPFTLFVFWLVGRINYLTTYKVYHAYGVMTEFFSEHLFNMKNIKAQASEDLEAITGAEAIRTRYRADIYQAIMGAISTLVGSFLTKISMIIIFVVGAYFVRNGTFQVQDLVTFNNFSNLMLPSLFEIITQYQTVKGAKGATAKLTVLIDVEKEKVSREISMKNITRGDIVFENVFFAFDSKQILHDVSFTIPKGKVTALIGTNGSGKSTILKLIERLYEPTSGTIKFGTLDVEKIHLNEWRQTLVYVSQNSPILSGTIRENIIYGVSREVSESEIEQAAKIANAYEFIQLFPEGFNTEVGEGGGKLSGGQKQRIAIARAVIMNPEYLLLDEATSNLDSMSEATINEALARLMEGRTTIKIAHDLKSIKNADNIIILDNGNILGTGTHKELYKKDLSYQKFVGVQTG